MTGRQVSERELQATLVEACRVLGWRVAHFRPAREPTAIALDNALALR